MCRVSLPFLAASLVCDVAGGLCSNVDQWPCNYNCAATDCWYPAGQTFSSVKRKPGLAPGNAVCRDESTGSRGRYQKHLPYPVDFKLRSIAPLTGVNGRLITLKEGLASGKVSAQLSP